MILDCNSTACFFAIEKGGQWNNGPCTCLEGMRGKKKTDVIRYIKWLQNIKQNPSPLPNDGDKA